MSNSKPSTAPLNATRPSGPPPDQIVGSLDDSGVFEGSFDPSNPMTTSPATSDYGNEQHSPPDKYKGGNMFNDTIRSDSGEANFLAGPSVNLDASLTSSLTSSSQQAKKKKKRRKTADKDKNSNRDNEISLTVDTDMVNDNIRKLRSTRPEGLSPHSLPLNGTPLFNSSGSSLNPQQLRSVLSSNKRAHDSTDPFSSPPLTKKKSSTKKEPHGNVFQRNSPNAKKALRSFLLNFTDDVTWKIKDSIDLYQHALDTGTAITNVLVQEVCTMCPSLRKLNLTNCTEVTDVGLWAIARCCDKLVDLRLSGCSGVSTVGLRSLAMKCTGIEYLDFSRCQNLDDGALRVIAAGMWNMEVFILTSCSNITDSGVAEIARCCHKLRVLDVSDCEKIGEYGDKALIEVGKYCHKLEILNMFGCKHVADAGIRAIALGCPVLKELQLTGCSELSGSAVKALATHCPLLKNLSIASCQRIENKDLIRLARHCTKLEKLDISECKNITSKGLEVLSQACENLETLNLSKCISVDDKALNVLSSGCVGLRNLNLAGCQSVSEKGIKDIAHGCTGIGYLNVTNCKNVTRRFLMHLITDLQFSDPAHTYFGYQPKANADELRIKAKELQIKNLCAIEIQRLIRGTLARGGVKEIRQAYIIKHQLPRAQAHIRGFLQLKKWRSVLRGRLQEWAATTIRAAWCGMLDRRTVRRMKNIKGEFDLRDGMALNIQRVYQGHLGRLLMQKIRNKYARIALIEAQKQARLEQNATIIQRVHRGHASRLVTEEMRKERDRLRALELLHIKMARILQRVVRGMFGRTVAKLARAAKELEEYKWRCSRKIQCCWRGKLGRDKARLLREFRDYQKAVNAATKIQSAWRAFRGKYIGKVAASLAGLRKLEQTAACKIQSSWRARIGRIKAKDKAAAMEETLKRMRAVLIVQRVFRGHKGRTAFAVKGALKKLEHRAKPLYVKLKNEESDLNVVLDKIKILKEVLEPLERDKKELEKEIMLILRSKAKYWDSDRISGAPQRFVTEWLKVRLKEKLEKNADRVEELQDQLAEMEIKEREKHRHIRHVKRELVPLTTGTIERTKIERTQRLRETVRAQLHGSTYIQKIFRGHHVRSSIYAEDRDYWIEDYDTTTGQNLYFNTWSQETRWRKPLSMILNEEFNLNAQQGGNEEGLVSVGGWVEMNDKTKGVVYWFNNSSNVYRWTQPEEFVDKSAETNSDWFDGQDSSELMKSSSATGKEIGFEWREMREGDTGEIFYANSATGDLKWSLSPRSAFKQTPGETLTNVEGEEAFGEIERRGNWTKFNDETQGTYYYNEETDETQWDPPEGFADDLVEE